MCIDICIETINKNQINSNQGTKSNSVIQLQYINETYNNYDDYEYLINEEERENSFLEEGNSKKFII